MREKRAGMLLKQINASLEKSANRALSEDDLTLSQVGLLLELTGAPDDTMSFKDLEKRLGLAQSTTVGLISRLEKKGMLQTRMDSSDGRIKYAALTQKGMECCEKAEKSMAQQEEVLLQNLNDNEREQFIEYLKKVNKALQEIH